MAESGSNKKMANSLVALSSAAVLVVYSAGYQRTKAAADRFEQQAATRRHAVPVPATPWDTGGVPATGTVARGQAAGATATPGETGGVPATGTVARGQAAGATATPRGIEGVPAAGTVARPSSAVPAPAPVAPTAVSRAAGSIPTEPAPGDPGHVIDGATATSTEPLKTANATPAEIAPATPPPRGRFKDGTYQGRGSCIHGDIQAQVVVKNGRILEATISSCETRYSCDWLDPILPQVAARQSAFVDFVSGATDSTDAFSAAVTDALLKAQ